MVRKRLILDGFKGGLYCLNLKKGAGYEERRRKCRKDEIIVNDAAYYLYLKRMAVISCFKTISALMVS